MFGSTPSSSALTGLPPVPVLVDRTRWNHFRRWWKDLAKGRPEDQLHTARIDEQLGRTLLFLAVGVSLLLAPAAGLWVHDAAARLGLLVLTGLALVAAGQLELLQRAGRGSAIAGVRGVLAGACVVAALGLTLALGGASRGWLEAWLPASLLLLVAIALWDEPSASLAAGATTLLGMLLFAGWSPAPAGAGPTPLYAALSAVGMAAATLLSAALAKRGRDLRRTAHRDDLTRLLGRQAMIACLAREAQRARRSALPMTLAVVHASGLASARQAHGSPFADAALCWLASLVHESVRSTDLVARFGDDQIVVAFLDSAHPVLQERLERLTRRSESLAPGDFDEAGGALAVKIGTAEFPVDDPDVAGVLSCAVERASLAAVGQVRSGNGG